MHHSPVLPPRRSVLLTAAVVACALSGCSRSSSAEDQAARRQRLREVARAVVLCRTADSTLRRLLGPPSRDGVLHRARVLSWMSPGDDMTRYLAVLLDSTGTVVDLYWDVPLHAPWAPASQCASPATASR